MCGIAGIYHLDGQKTDRQKLVRFTDSLAHRGPDGSGYTLHDEDTLGLGHRRLSILDLSELGRQPMSYADGRYTICYNGEVFNFAEIKKELESKKYTFVSNTDTEVILAAYIEYGADCLHRFNGMWALAIWDETEKELFLARDRFGIKPLYYTYTPDRLFAFASETRSFRFLDGFARRLDERLLQYNLSDSYSLEGEGYTPFEGIVQLLPGHHLLVKKGRALQQKRWWHIKDFVDPHSSLSFDEQKEKFYELFRDACRIRLISDVPVGTALSGGVDSTAVYSTVFDIMATEQLSRANKDSQRAFTAIFPGLPNDEKEFADKAVAFTGGKINYTDIKSAGLAESILNDTVMADCISASPLTAISSVYAGMRKEGVLVSMDGHGVDEMLFGYRDMIYSLYNNALWGGSVGDAENYSKVLLDMYHAANREKAEQRFAKELSEKQQREKSLSWKFKRLIRPSDISSDDYKKGNLPSLSDKPYDFGKEKLEDRMLYHEFFVRTLPALLRNFDRAGMMHGVEIRMPFMDWRLVSFVFSLSAASKTGQGFTKLILREAMKGRMSEEIRTRKFKVGIGSPLEYWMNGPLKEWTLDMVKDPALKAMLDKSRQGTWELSLTKQAWKNINVELIR
jgi:asparagine synthase (glutamine-hydrolysing)